MAQKQNQNNIVTKKHLARDEREKRQLKVIMAVTISVLVIVLGLLAYGLIDSYIIKPNEVVASVGDVNITAGDFQTNVKFSRLNQINQAYSYYQYAQMFGEMGSSFLTTSQQIVAQLSDSVSFGSQVLDQMIDDVLIREEAEKLGITVSQEEIDKELMAAFEFFPNGTPIPTAIPTNPVEPTLSSTQLALLQYTDTPTPMPTATSTPEGWSLPTNTPSPTVEVEETSAEVVEAEPTQEPTQTPTATPYTTQGYARALDDYINQVRQYGFKKDDLNKLFEMNLLREKVSEKITEDLEPIQEQVWARHILVETEEEAKDIIERLESGEEWNLLASEKSIDSSNAQNGGDLGWFGRGAMVSEFEEAAFNLEIGEISAPIQTSFGWHIIQLISKGNNPLDANAFQSIKDQTFNTWLSDLRSSRSDIVLSDNWQDLVPTDPQVPNDFIATIYGSQ